MLAYHDGMADRSTRAAQAQRAEVDDYVRSVAGNGGAAA
jgi:phytoene/squalene synthetase